MFFPLHKNKNVRNQYTHSHKTKLSGCFVHAMNEVKGIKRMKNSKTLAYEITLLFLFKTGKIRNEIENRMSQESAIKLISGSYSNP